MTSLQIVIMIIIVNSMISSIYLINAFLKKVTEKKISGFIMLLSPPAGTIYYFGQFIVLKILKYDKEMQMEDIGFSKERHSRILEPDVETETQSVPFEEILLVSDDSIKRRQLLFELKKDYIFSYSTIIKALDDEDPETSHYAASAVTSAKTDFENDIRELDSLYEHNKNDLEMVRTYSNYIFSYLKSGILGSMEIRKYKFLFLKILTTVEDYEFFLNEDDYKNIVDEAVSLEEFAIAEKWAKIGHEKFESESTYLNMMKVYYYTNQTEQFFEMLDHMKKSDISLSYKGLDLVRYFLKKQS